MWLFVNRNPGQGAVEPESDMARTGRRLVEQYKAGDLVEIRFANDPQQRWLPGRVVQPEPPGLWVMLLSGQRFFVTNTRHIRPLQGGGRP